MLMKKAILTLLVSVGVIVATATIYPYLNVGLNNGTEVSYPATDWHSANWQHQSRQRSVYGLWPGQ